MTEKQLIKLFEPYGKIAESFINVEKNFAFCKVDTRANAEQAKRELNGSVYKNRPLRVRFAPNSAAVIVGNLTKYVSNELLHKSFEIFGKVEHAKICVDDRGTPTGTGLVEFARKSSAMAAIRYCTEKCFFLTTSLRPCICQLNEEVDDNDGCPEKTMNKKNQDFYKERSIGPRFADVGSFEHEYGTRWKQLSELYIQKTEAIQKEWELEKEKLEAQMEYARYEHETEMLREKLRFREMVHTNDDQFRFANQCYNNDGSLPFGISLQRMGYQIQNPSQSDRNCVQKACFDYILEEHKLTQHLNAPYANVSSVSYCLIICFIVYS